MESRARIPLTEEEFSGLVKAREVLVEALSAEERIAVVWENYVDYEAVLLRGAVEDQVFSYTSWSEFSTRIHQVNRSLVNLLSSCRGYIDQAKHSISGFFGRGSPEFKSVREWFREQHASLLGYRVMEALRNHAQHRGMAVHKLSSQHWWNSSRTVARTALIPFIRPAILREDSKFNVAVIEELEAGGESVDLRPLVKQYVAGISIVHGSIRSMLEDQVQEADRTFQDAVARYRTQEDETVGLAAFRRDPQGVTVERVAILEDLMSKREVLETRQRIHRNLWMHFVTNEPKTTDANGG